MEDYLLTIIFLAIIGALFMAWYFSHKSKAEERKMLIEKGFSPSELPESRKFKFPWLKVGIFLMISSAGFSITRYLLQLLTEEGIYDGEAFMLLLLFIGFGLIASHFLPKKLKGNSKDEN